MISLKGIIGRCVALSRGRCDFAGENSLWDGCVPIGDGSNPEWGRTGYRMEESRDLSRAVISGV